MVGVDHSEPLNRKICEAFPTLQETELPQRFMRAAVEGEGWQTRNLFTKVAK